MWENLCVPCWLAHWVRQPSGAKRWTEGRCEGGLWLHQSLSVCSSQECWEIICGIVPPGIFSCSLSSLAVSNSSDRHPALPWEEKNSSANTVGKTMRFQGNAGNLLENRSNVKGLLNVTLKGLLVWARDRLGQFYAYWQWHWIRALLYVSILCCNLLSFLFRSLHVHGGETLV